jgi:hypothetical protein
MENEVAALLGLSGGAIADSKRASGDAGKTAAPEEAAAAPFSEVTKKFADIPNDGLSDPNYYKTALSGEGEPAQRVHGILQKYMNTKDPAERGVFRQQFITAFWDFLGGVANKASGKLPDPKKFLLRFGLLHPAFLSAEARALFAKIIVDNDLGAPVYYLDEWFHAIGTGAIRNSTTDETQVPKSSDAVKLRQLLEKAAGKLDGLRGMLKTKNDERLTLEKALAAGIHRITEHFPLEDLPHINACYTGEQKQAFSDVQELLKNLLRTGREAETLIRDYTQQDEIVRTLEGKIGAEGGAVEADAGAIAAELGTIRQMAKMTIGRQGNHFPILSNEYFHCGPNDVGVRENVVSILARIERIDPEAFCRIYKNKLNHILPFVILLPTYGDMGLCWEPYDKFNKATSRGRIALPMYPKNLVFAALSAVADLRWQTAKEKASYYWMEEGLTGNYYQWFSARKIKGDVKAFFIQDYITWITKESEGIQKLDKELRGIFWRSIPFSQPVKEKLKGRNLVYQELYQRDINRTLSDGY